MQCDVDFVDMNANAMVTATATATIMANGM
jgi:hypothetical protein